MILGSIGARSSRKLYTDYGVGSIMNDDINEYCIYYQLGSSHFLLDM